MNNDDPIWDRERPSMDWEPKPVLYQADGTPLRRQMGFVMQTSQTFPNLNKRPPRKGGKKKPC